MLRQLRVFLWEIVSELEMRLYPYYDESSIRMKTPATEDDLTFQWLKSYDERIDRLQDEMIWVKSKINELQNEQLKTKDL